jgi:hypothetical protein
MLTCVYDEGAGASVEVAHLAGDPGAAASDPAGTFANARIELDAAGNIKFATHKSVG